MDRGHAENRRLISDDPFQKGLFNSNFMAAKKKNKHGPFCICATTSGLFPQPLFILFFYHFFLLSATSLEALTVPFLHQPAGEASKETPPPFFHLYFIPSFLPSFLPSVLPSFQNVSSLPRSRVVFVPSGRSSLL